MSHIINIIYYEKLFVNINKKTLDNFKNNQIQKCNEKTLKEVCTEALLIMDHSSQMETHVLAQSYIRQNLEKLSERLIEGIYNFVVFVLV